MSKKIAIIQKAKSYIVNSLSDRLKSLRYDTVCVYASPNDISLYAEMTDALVLYLDSDFVKDYLVMECIRDTIARTNQLLFLIGDQDEIMYAEKIISRRKVANSFVRPIDVNQVSMNVDLLLQYGVDRIKKKVLVVDDSGAMLRNVKGWLGDKYDVTLVNSGEFAMKYLASNYPDLILLDYEMPGMSGKDVLQAIRSNIKIKELPVIFLTSKGDKSDVMEVMSLKPEGYILKTEEPEKIVQRIDEFFNG